MPLKSFANPGREFGCAEQQENADKESHGAGEYTGLVLRTEIYPNGCVCVGEGGLCKTIDREQVNQVGYGLGKSVYADQDNTGRHPWSGVFGGFLCGLQVLGQQAVGNGGRETPYKQPCGQIKAVDG